MLGMNACIFSTMNIEMKRTIKMQKLQITAFKSKLQQCT